MIDVAIVAAVGALVALVRERLGHLPVTGPMIFVAAGLLLSKDTTGLLTIDFTSETVALIAELTLAMVLFSDAARIDIRGRRAIALPARLLGIGLPLTIGLGTVMTAYLLTDLGWIEAALVATVLAPTDAALGEAVVSNRSVPVRIRQALNIESGLNDGLVVPVFALLLALAIGDEVEGAGFLAGEAAAEIAIGIGVGAALAVAVSAAIKHVALRSWTDAEGLRLVAFACALGTFATSTALGGNGFLAAFVCGLVLRHRLGSTAAGHIELAEDAGQVGAAVTFVLFGALIVIPALEALSWLVVACAVATLTIGRMIPVGISMIGSGLKLPTIGFLGWFGPRGLASMLFGLLIVTETGGDMESAALGQSLFSVITLVVLASIVAHGITAAPGASRYGAWFDGHGNFDRNDHTADTADAAGGDDADADDESAGVMAEAEMVPSSRIRGRRSPT